MVLFGDSFEGQGLFAFVGAKGEAVADSAGLEFGKTVVVREDDVPSKRHVDLCWGKASQKPIC